MIWRVFAALNAPESGKSGLLGRVARAAAVLAWMARARVSIAFVQESGTYLQGRIAQDRRRRLPGIARARQRVRVGWQAVYAPPTAHGAGGRRRGVGIVVRRRHFKVIKEYVRKVPWADSPTGFLYIIVALVEDRKTGKRQLVASNHSPTVRADPDGSTRRALNRAIVRLDRAAARLGLHFTCGADSNDGQWMPDLEGSRLKRAAQHKVSWLVTSAPHRNEQHHDQSRTSDHGKAVTAEIAA